jgi:cell division transport system ATP-binding protein
VPSVIRLYDVSKVYPSGRVALREVTLHVHPGEFVLVTGPTGCGKSTLLRVLFGDEQPTSGRGIVNGRNLNRLDGASLAKLRRELGLVFQDARLIERLTVLENVALAAEVGGMSRAKAVTRAGELLEMIGLAEHADAAPLGLSAGERQRVSLARALINRPALLLADEPTGSLDPDASLEIIALLKEVNDDGTTVVVATHDQDALAALDCRTLMMFDGRLVEETERLTADL